jgi:cytoskeletal protein CcmA (bactofilin family)
MEGGMKRIKFILPLVMLVLALAWPGTALASGLADDQVVFGGSFTLSEGETLEGDLVVFGGSSTLEAGSTVTGDVVMFGGSISVNGEIQGSLVTLGGLVSLDSGARVRGDLVAPGGSISRDEGSEVSGDVITGPDAFFNFSMPAGVVVDRTPTGLRIFTDVLWFLFRTFAWALLAVLVVIFLPRQSQTVARAVIDQPIVIGGIGLLTLVVGSLVVLILTLTLVLIPVSLLLVIAIGLAYALGKISLGLEVGERLGRALGQSWAPPLSAGIGTFLLAFVVNSVGLVDCIGWVAPAFVILLALGGVVMTRFGTQAYPAMQPDLPIPPALGEPLDRTPPAPKDPPSEAPEAAQDEN